MQGVNLGGIGSEVFKTLQEVAERLSTYYDDYLQSFQIELIR